MSLAPELLAVLADPIDHGPLTFDGERLVNPRRGVGYPVVDGIPVLVPGAEYPWGDARVRST
jgi:uncharacterized protein YbaR (Trm112 family)